MKKFYTIALATAVALSASAGTELKLRDNADFSNKAVSLKADKAGTMLKKQTSTLSAATPSLKAKKAASATDIAGDYTITIGDYYNGQDGFGDVELDCTVEVQDNKFYILCEELPTDLVGTFDAASGKITFNNVPLGQLSVGNDLYYVQIEPFIYDWNANGGQGDIVPQSYSVTYSNGAVSFPTDHGFAWAAYIDANYTQLKGYAAAYDVLNIEKSSGNGGGDDDTAWTSLGNATLMDGWVLPAFGLDQTDPANQWEVELQQNNDNANLYRLVDPYHGNCPVADYNETSKKGYIQFNVSDPDHVVFDVVEAGFANSQLDITKFYCINILVSLMDYYDMPAEELVSQLGEGAPYTTFKDGVVTLGSKIASNGNLVYDACFGDQTGKYAGYSWVNSDKSPADMSAKIIFPETGIDSVLAGESDAPVKFFNLQGIEVSKPAAGQVVIRKQGDKATKLLAR